MPLSGIHRPPVFFFGPWSAFLKISLVRVRSASLFRSVEPWPLLHVCIQLKSNIRDKTNRYLSSATKELNTGIDKLSVAVNKNLQAYYDTPGSNFENNQNHEHEENSSEDSLMDDKGPGGPDRRANLLPRPPR